MTKGEQIVREWEAGNPIDTADAANLAEMIDAALGEEREACARLGDAIGNEWGTKAEQWWKEHDCENARIAQGNSVAAPMAQLLKVKFKL